jgi:hypothetical protein
MRITWAAWAMGLALGAAACTPGTANCPATQAATNGGRGVDDAALERIAAALLRTHGEAQAERIRLGLRQVAERWWPSDGTAEELQAFAEEHFIADPEALAETLRHLEYALEQLDGSTNLADRELARFQDLDQTPQEPVDGLLAAFAPSAHLNDDLFASRVAFVGLLNFPITSLDERVREGLDWSRDRWAAARLAGRFEHRVPADVLQGIEKASAAADGYIDGYNIRMDRLYRENDPAGFAPDLSLISHWGLREEIRAQYGQEGGLERQRLVATVMDRIVRQEILAEVIDSADREWDPIGNRVRAVGESEWRPAEREADVRYRRLLDVFQSRRAADPYFPALPTHIARSFALDREMPEDRVRALLLEVLTAPAVKEVANVIRTRLERPLEPFDLWFTGFRATADLDEADLTAETRTKYPTADAFRADLPRILERLGFTPETAAYLAGRIVVEPSRGPGEALGAMMRTDQPRLRTRVGPEGMDYKGFNIAVHELGHTVEQTFSLERVDHTLLQGVPNTGFTEAFAFLFQARDLELLGRTPPEGAAAEHEHAADRLWDAFEICGVALLDLEIWHWMYDHPDATPAELRQAMVAQAISTWNTYFAPVFGVSDSPILAIYSHIIAYGLYTPDYPLGMLITSQVEQYVKTRNLAEEMERMCTQGRLAPDVWMQKAVGAPVSAEALLSAADAAVAAGL